MRYLEPDEQAAWLEMRGMGFRCGVPLIPGKGLSVLGMKNPDRTEECAELAWALVDLGNDETENGSGVGLFRITDWGIWAAETDSVGRHLASKLTAHPDFDDAGAPERASLFAGEERRQATALLFLAMAFQWDAWFVPDSGAFVTHISHDGYSLVIARSDGDASHVRSALQHWGVGTPNETTIAMYT